MNRDDAKKLADEALDQLAQQLQQGHSEQLTNYLNTMARFHHYSFGNIMLIALQRPEATHVAGFNAWRKFGRFVKKGEKGIAILAPITYRKKQDDDEEDEPQTNGRPRKVLGFKVAHVFDVAQTDGEALPEFATVKGEPGQHLERLKALIAADAITLVYEVIPGGALGESSGGQIRICPDQTPAREFSVLVHELAHERLHRGDRRSQTTKKVRETEAEAVAYVVCRTVGLETTTAAADYIQLYQGTKETLAESLDEIQRVAADIIAALKPPQ